MGSRVRIATANFLVASGLLVGGAGAALAIAEPGLERGDGVSGAGRTGNDATRPRARETDDSAERRTSDDRPKGERDDKEPVDGKRGDGEPRRPDDAGDHGTDDVDAGHQHPHEDGEPTATETPEPTETEVPPAPPTKEPEQPGSCEEKSDDDCEPGWPWWPWPWPRPPGDAPGGGGGGAAVEAPSGRPDLPATMLLPPELLPRGEPADPIEPASAVPGVTAQLPLAPISLPLIAAATAGLGGGADAAPAPLPRAPRIVEAEPPAGRQPPPADAMSNASGPVTSYRAGYTDYLRTAGLSQVIALAAPGLAGMLVLTGAGGLVGYRHAKAGHAVRTGGAARFVN